MSSIQNIVTVDQILSLMAYSFWRLHKPRNQDWFWSMYSVPCGTTKSCNLWATRRLNYQLKSFDPVNTCSHCEGKQKSINQVIFLDQFIQSGEKIKWEKKCGEQLVLIKILCPPEPVEKLTTVRTNWKSLSLLFHRQTLCQLLVSQMHAVLWLWLQTI